VKNDSIVLDLNKVKLSFDGDNRPVLPIPLWDKSKRYLKQGFPKLATQKNNFGLFSKFKRSIKNAEVAVRKIVVYTFWLFLSQKYEGLQILTAEIGVNRLRHLLIQNDMKSRLSKHYMEYYFSVNKKKCLQSLLEL